MNEGKELLTLVINTALEKISTIDDSKQVVYGINIPQLVKKLAVNNHAITTCTDDFIDFIFATNPKISSQIIKDFKQSRDLLLGQQDYNLKVTLQPKHEEAITKFNKTLNKYIESADISLTDTTSLKERLMEVLNAVMENGIIKDFDIIKTAVKYYNAANYDNILVKLFKYINRHNLAIITSSHQPSSTFKVRLTAPIDNRLNEILARLKLDINELPHNIRQMLSAANIDKIYQTYNFVRRNKAEDYGILHLFAKENKIGKLLLLILSDEQTIKNVVDTTKDDQGTIDIPSLKIICNSLFPVFISEEVQQSYTYYHSKHQVFMTNIKMLKDLEVNYRSVLKKDPLFFLVNNEVLEFTLNYLETYGASKKQIINYCYKILSVNPTLLIDNIKILSKYNIDITDYLKNPQDNYNILKCINLDYLLRKIESATKHQVTVYTYAELNKMILKIIIYNL